MEKEKLEIIKKIKDFKDNDYKGKFEFIYNNELIFCFNSDNCFSDIYIYLSDKISINKILNNKIKTLEDFANNLNEDSLLNNIMVYIKKNYSHLSKDLGVWLIDESECIEECHIGYCVANICTEFDGGANNEIYTYEQAIDNLIEHLENTNKEIKTINFDD